MSSGFIVLAALITAILFGIQDVSLAFVGFGIVGFMMFALYYTAGHFLGFQPAQYWEFVSEDSVIPDFDWRRFVFEPLFFIAAFLVVLIYSAVAVAVRWAMTGSNS